MKTKFYFIDYSNKSRKITKKEAMSLITERQLQEAKETFKRDPYVSNEYMVRGGRVVIEFEY